MHIICSHTPHTQGPMFSILYPETLCPHTLTSFLEKRCHRCLVCLQELILGVCHPQQKLASYYSSLPFVNGTERPRVDLVHQCSCPRFGVLSWWLKAAGATSATSVTAGSGVPRSSSDRGSWGDTQSSASVRSAEQAVGWWPVGQLCRAMLTSLWPCSCWGQLAGLPDMCWGPNILKYPFVTLVVFAFHCALLKNPGW